jgi:DNA polymerase IV
MDAPRWIAHLEMDAFYASVELLRYPQLKGQAVVIGGRRADAPEQLADGSWRYARLRHYTGRGVVTTSTYAARDLGVFSAMGLMKAALRAPDAILLPADFDSYRKYSRLFKAAVAEVAPVIEDRGIDEIYIDLSDVPGVHEAVAHDPLGGVQAVAREIKNSVMRATGLSCSIGITPNKLLSKIASELDKPDGITVLTLADIPGRIWPLAVRKVNGIGPKAGDKLHPRHRDRGRHRRCRSGAPRRALRRQLRHLAARRRPRPRQPPHRHPQRTRLDQPRNHLRARPARGARPQAARCHPR